MTKFKSLFPPFVWMAIIFIFSSIPNLELSGEFCLYDFFLRKLAHIAEYAILFLLWNHALGNWKKAFAISFVYAIFDEIHQNFVPTRDGRVVDVVVDGAGIYIGWFVLILRKKLKPKVSISNI